ncbi:MAG: hypothetical protein HKN51_02190, partial [Saprospiraceae bacterium]|nr:hypothetical protein [Saprospiraceae bacterium]
MKTIGLSRNAPSKFKKRFLTILTCLTFGIFFTQSISAQNLCEMAQSIDCGLRDGNNDTGMFTTENYCGSSSNLTGPEIVFEINPPQSLTYTFDLQVFGAGQDLDMFLLNSNCNPNNCI